MNAKLRIELFNTSDVIATSAPGVVYCAHGGFHALVTDSLGWVNLLSSYQAYVDLYSYNSATHTLVSNNARGNASSVSEELVIGQFYHIDPDTGEYVSCGSASHGI